MLSEQALEATKVLYKLGVFSGSPREKNEKTLRTRDFPRCFPNPTEEGTHF